MRYQTSSIRKNAKPTPAAAPSTNAVGAAGGSALAAGAAGTGVSSPASGRVRATARAVCATSMLTRQASHNVRWVPNVSSMKKVARNDPVTAPSVFTPYSRATARRPRSSSDSTARAAAGNVPPINTVGSANTSVARTSRSAVPAPRPSVALPPRATYARRTTNSRAGVAAAAMAIKASSRAYSASGRG